MNHDLGMYTKSNAFVGFTTLLRPSLPFAVPNPI